MDLFSLDFFSPLPFAPQKQVFRKQFLLLPEKQQLLLAEQAHTNISLEYRQDRD